MQGIIAVIVRLIRAGKQAYTRKWSFLALFAVALFGSVSVLAELDLLPEVRTAAPASVELAVRAPAAENAAPAPVAIEFPVKVEVPKLGLSTTIANPTTTSIEALDAELLRGAVRYPTSAKLGETGNVVLFGHSSYLPIVKNKAYKTFNDIQKLMPGDAITVYSDTVAYSYQVRTVSKENAESGAIPLSVTGKVLTLATCNSFGTKEDRFVVVADFVESHLVGS